MFRNSRVLHRWIGILTSLFMVSMAATGLLLALKKRFDWIQPPSQKGTVVAQMRDMAHISEVADAIFALELPEIKERDDFDRFELHADKNIYKVTSKTGYKEVQVDATTAKVLSVAQRNDQLIEHLHDFQFWGGAMYTWILPLTAFALLALGLSGIYMFFVPVYRRWLFRRKGGASKVKTSQ